MKTAKCGKREELQVVGRQTKVHAEIVANFTVVMQQHTAHAFVNDGQLTAFSNTLSTLNFLSALQRGDPLAIEISGLQLLQGVTGDRGLSTPINFLNGISSQTFRSVALDLNGDGIPFREAANDAMFEAGRAA